MRRLRLLIAAGALTALAACGVLTTTNINSLLGSSAASTALSYIAGLNPTIAGYLNDANSAIAANAPKVLSDTCGAVSMGNEIVTTIEAIDPTLIPASTQKSLAASFAAASPLCPPNAAPTNVTQAAQALLLLYQALNAAWTNAGVTVPAATSGG